MNFSKLIISSLILIILLAGCDNGNDDDTFTPAQSSATSFTVTIENVNPDFEYAQSGVFSIPVGDVTPGPIGPGGAYEVTFSAAPGARFSFATMFIPSNDFFYAPDETGIALFNPDGSQVSGNVTSQVLLWDAGTEINQEPGVGLDQVQRQAAPNTGALDPDTTVRLAPDTFANLPAVASVVLVTVTPVIDGTGTSFLVRIENVSTATTLLTSAPAPDDMQAVPLSPGIFVVHFGDSPLFTSGIPDFGVGLEGVAEDGDTTLLSATTSADTGLVVPLSPGVATVHFLGDPLFTVGLPDFGEGLEDIAEDGVASVSGSFLAANLNALGLRSSLVFDTPVGSATPGAIGPGGSYQFSFFAFPGDALSFATMFVASNDFFFAPDDDGIPLFNTDGTPVSGNVTTQVLLWDAGTEINQEPGVGLDQVQRQAAPNTGALDPDNTVRLAPDTFGNLPPNTQVIRVTITPN